MSQVRVFNTLEFLIDVRLSFLSVPGCTVSVPLYYSTYTKCKVTQSFPFLITIKPLIMSKRSLSFEYVL